MSEGVWWKSGIVYQIYPRSFQDSNGDGVGDLEGIRSRLGYLVRLGVDAIWLSPFYPSPMADFGYDISDYCNVDPVFGSLGDFDELLTDAHRHNLKVIVDLVPNHTSDRHPWFLESRGSRSARKRDWYLWRDPNPNGGPPNNWLGNFAGSAWTLDDATGQYYFHAFLKEQPDLNWRNREVRAAMYDVMRFWLRRGVDGFRVDVIYHLIKDELFRDNPLNPTVNPGEQSSHAVIPLYTTDRPEVQEIVAEMRRVADEFGDVDSQRVLVGEIYLPLPRLMAYYGPGENGILQGVQLPFNFQLIGAPWKSRAIDRIVREYESMLPAGGWPNWVLGNHDKPRIASRVGMEQARVAAMLLLTLRGTPTLYYGDEIGMQDVPIPRDEIRDPFEKNEPGKGVGRDPERTPMQWDDSPNAGFTTGRPWLRLAGDCGRRNVAALDRDPQSILSLYRQLIVLRRLHAALTEGGYEPLDAEGDLFAFARVHGTERLLVAVNFGAERVTIPPAILPPSAIALLSTHLDRDGPLHPPLVLRPNEGLIFAPVSSDVSNHAGP
jgi:alpha-glucosidase